MKNGTLAIDADGVLLDYNQAYAQAWEKAFGYFPKVRTPEATNLYEHFAVPVLIGPELQHLQSFFNDEFWSTIPAMPGALNACQALVDAGYGLVCVTALHNRFRDARVDNLRMNGFALEEVYTTGSSTMLHSNPKLNTLMALKPLAFVDDYEPYFQGVPATMHRAFIANRDHALLLAFADSSHTDIASFAKAWLLKSHPGKATP